MSGRRAVVICAVLCSLLGPTSARAINVVVDYTYDTNGFFAVGSQARASLEAVAGYYSAILDDTFSPIVTPAPYTSSLPPEENPGTAQWLWTMTFTNPSSNANVTITNPTVAADEYRLFVGAKNLAAPTLGQGGPGGGTRQSTNNGGFFTTEEIAELEAIDEQFKSQVSQRGEASGFSRWGGVVAFDLDAAWHFDQTTLPSAGINDFYSVATHEIGHALGLGSSTEWTALTAGAGNGAYFFGEAAVASYGNVVPLAFNVIGGNPVADKAHWRDAVKSPIFGSSTLQEAAMDPSITAGTRKRLTALDAAALTDIGWTVVAPPYVLPGDYNGDEIVNAADYTVWRNNFGSSEPLLNDDSPGVDYDDYERWKSNFGNSANPGGGSISPSTVVPEPSPQWLALAGAAILLNLRANPRRRLSPQ